MWDFWPTTSVPRFWVRQLDMVGSGFRDMGLGFKDSTPIMAKRKKINMENDIESGIHVECC